MEAPKCKLCGERHYGLCKRAGKQGAFDREGTPGDPAYVSGSSEGGNGEPGQAGAAGSIPAQSTKPQAARQAKGSPVKRHRLGPCPSTEEKPLRAYKPSDPIFDLSEPAGQAAAAVLAWAVSKPKFDRTAYQRDYMRKRRAKEKK